MTNDWQPMDTAPTDGTEILGLDEDGNEFEFRFAERRQCMLAGIGGGNGYFGPGWEDVFNGLIIDTPIKWKEIL